MVLLQVWIHLYRPLLKMEAVGRPQSQRQEVSLFKPIIATVMFRLIRTRQSM